VLQLPFQPSASCVAHTKNKQQHQSDDAAAAVDVWTTFIDFQMSYRSIKYGKSREKPAIATDGIGTWHGMTHDMAYDTWYQLILPAS